MRKGSRVFLTFRLEVFMKLAHTVAQLKKLAIITGQGITQSTIHTWLSLFSRRRLSSGDKEGRTKGIVDREFWMLNFRSESLFIMGEMAFAHFLTTIVSGVNVICQFNKVSKKCTPDHSSLGD